MDQKRPVTHTTDHLNREIVRVRLTRGLTATVLKSDYDAITARGFSNWYANTNGMGRYYASIIDPERPDGRPAPLSVARIITGCSEYQRVCYRDADSMNLLPENLYVARKGNPNK